MKYVTLTQTGLEKNAYYEYPLSQAILMGYPWLLRNGIDRRDDIGYLRRSIQRFLQSYCNVAFDSTSDIVKRIKKTGWKSPNGVFGLENIDNLNVLMEGKEYQLTVGFTNAQFLFQRYGREIGIKCESANKDQHEKATADLTTLAAEDYCIMPFYHKIIVSHKLAHHMIDLATELVDMARFVPMVKWRTDCGEVADLLYKNFIGDTWDEIVVGYWFENPVYMDLELEHEEIDRQLTDTVRRRGLIESFNSPQIKLMSNGTPAFRVRYYMRTEDNNNYVKSPDHQIKYNTEQCIMKSAMSSIANGIKEREYEDVSTRNSHYSSSRMKSD